MARRVAVRIRDPRRGRRGHRDVRAHDGGSQRRPAGLRHRQGGGFQRRPPRPGPLLHREKGRLSHLSHPARRHPERRHHLHRPQGGRHQDSPGHRQAVRRRRVLRRGRGGAAHPGGRQAGLARRGGNRPGLQRQSQHPDHPRNPGHRGEHGYHRPVRGGYGRGQQLVRRGDVAGGGDLHQVGGGRQGSHRHRGTEKGHGIPLPHAGESGPGHCVEIRI